jgi:hypothetical protein
MKKILGTLALAAAVVIPAASFAQTFAYVNTSGEVTSIEAANANVALATAPNMDIHSGVILISSASDPIVGDKI